MADMHEAEPVLTVGAQLGEGPVWDDRERALYFVDILGQRVHAWEPGKGQSRSFATGCLVGAVGLRHDGGLVLACADHFALCHNDGSHSSAVEGFSLDGNVVRFNDGKVDPMGRFVAGTMDCLESSPYGNLYALWPDGGVHLQLEGVTISNGLDWSADGRSMYYIDTPRCLVEVFDYDLADGALSGRRPLVQVRGGFPDGMAIDQEGCLWVAIWDGGRVDRYTPGGRLDMSVAVPEGGRVSSVAFGGEDMSTLFVTTAQKDLSEAELAAAPRAGDIFAFAAPASGVPPYRFGGPGPK